MQTQQLLVKKDNLSETRIHQLPDTALREGQIRLRVNHFALTSNNITYAAFGGTMSYWNFFPSDEAGWGIIPVWGFATVTQSLHPGVAVGEKLYGYFPMASSVPAQTAGRHSGDWLNLVQQRGVL